MIYPPKKNHTFSPYCFLNPRSHVLIVFYPNRFPTACNLSTLAIRFLEGTQWIGFCGFYAQGSLVCMANMKRKRLFFHGGICVGNQCMKIRWLFDVVVQLRLLSLPRVAASMPRKYFSSLLRLARSSDIEPRRRSTGRQSKLQSGGDSEGEWLEAGTQIPHMVGTGRRTAHAGYRQVVRGISRSIWWGWKPVISCQRHLY